MTDTPGAPADENAAADDNNAGLDSELAEIAAQSDVPGAQADSPLHFSPRAWWAILKRVWVMNDFHNLALLSAGVAFYAFLAFVPTIAGVVLVYGLIGDPKAVAESMSVIDNFVPADAAGVIRSQLMSIVTTSAGVKGLGLAIAIFVAIFGAMRSSSAMMKALNIIYEERESRNIASLYLVSATITTGMIGVGLIGVIAVSIFSYIEIVLTRYLGTGAIAAFKLLTWASAGVLVSLTIAIFYRYAPDRRGAKWRWLSLGSVASTLLWVAATVGFGLYAANVSDYNATYGSLAAVVIFQMWLFLSAYAVLLGAEINAEMERQTFQDTTVGRDRPIGERGAVMADNVVIDEINRTLMEKKQRRRSERARRKAEKTSAE